MLSHRWSSPGCSPNSACGRSPCAACCGAREAWWWDDGIAHAGPWGFELAAIEVPVLLMHGRQDQFVPFGHGQWLAARIPGVDVRLLDDDGHLTLITNRMGEVHAWLADHL